MLTDPGVSRGVRSFLRIDCVPGDWGGRARREDGGEGEEDGKLHCCVVVRYSCCCVIQVVAVRGAWRRGCVAERDKRLEGIR